jgi:peptidylprolyl isomerase
VERTVRAGDTITIHYTAKIVNGAVISTANHLRPISFTVGRKEVIPGIDRAVRGMRVGESKKIIVAPHDAFGVYNERLCFMIPKSKFPRNVSIAPKKRLRLIQNNNTFVDVHIKKIHGEEVVLDANHPFAGQELLFTIRLVSLGKKGNTPVHTPGHIPEREHAHGRF